MPRIGTFENELGKPSLVLHFAGLALVPALLAGALPILILCNRYIRVQELDMLHWDVALGNAGRDWLDAMSSFGPFGVSLVIAGNFASFGILTSVCLVASRFWNPKRIWCMMGIGLIAGVSSANFEGYAYVFDQMISSRAGWSSIFSLTGQLTWDAWTWQYPYQIAILALLVGGAIAMLPCFRPSGRFYQRRGLCPRCHYDLRHKTEAGCPECGWNRPADAARSDEA